MKLLITAGATREPLDAVRFLSNVSTGLTGAALAEAMCDAGHSVTLLTGEGVVVKGRRDGQRHVFSSAADLSAQMRRLLSSGDYDAVIMTAAVSDYRPAELAPGKISSGSPELTLRLVRNEKILPQLKSFSPRAVRVIGFKLTVAATPAVARAAVAAQFAAGGVDLVVQNDLAEIRAVPREVHPFWIYRAADSLPDSAKGVSALARALSEFLDQGDRIRM